MLAAVDGAGGAFAELVLGVVEVVLDLFGGGELLHLNYGNWGSIMGLKGELGTDNN